MIRPLLVASLLAGAPVTPFASAQTLPARAEDVASADAIVTAVYNVISGPAGQQRDWDRMRSLFIPGARLIPAFRRQDGTTGHRVLTVEEYVTLSGPQLQANGFFEREIGRVEERYGDILHRFSAYDSRRALDDPEPFARGINSFQLFNDGSRWWIVTIYWQGETRENPIPSRYLRP